MTYLLSFYFDIKHSDFKLNIMKNLTKLFNCCLIISALILAGCGYMSDEAVENIDVFKTDELQTCQIDVSKLAKIFKENQAQQIRCIEENFVQFTKYVKSKDPNVITEKEIGLFVKRFFVDQSEKIVNSLSLIFQLNMILLKDESDKISHQNIHPLFDLLIEVNKEAVIISNIFKHMDSLQLNSHFWKMRSEFRASALRFSNAAKEATLLNQNKDKELVLSDFVNDIGSKLGNDSFDSETLNSFLFLKKTFLGGKDDVITTDELRTLFTKLPEVLGLIFDLYYSKSGHFASEQEEIKFYLDSINQFRSLIDFKQANFELMTSDEIVKVAKKFFKEYDVESFKESIEALKQKFIGGSKTSITLKDLNVAISMIKDFFEKVYFVHVTYDEPRNAILLKSTDLVTSSHILYKRLPEYKIFSTQERINQLYNSFIDISSNFRYFRNPEVGSAFYDREISRNKTGFIEVNISKWLAWKLLTAYGHSDAQGHLQITIDEFSNFLLDAKPILQELNLWTVKFQTFSRNVVLLADLFQEQSNGDLKMNLNETTEYIGMLLTAVSSSGKVAESVAKTCADLGTAEVPAYKADCFKQKFFSIFLVDLNYQAVLPRLRSYYEKSSSAELLNYLEGVSGFARENNAPGIPVNRKDITLITGALLNIETTFIRFDTNRDNVIDYHELSRAFLVYKKSIIDIAGLQPDQEKYAKAVFLYMVSRMEIPKTGTWFKDVKFGAFASCVEKGWCRWTLDKVEAKRLNIGQLLYYMVNQKPEDVSLKK